MKMTQEQEWKSGSIVKVGFMQLRVVRKLARNEEMAAGHSAERDDLPAAYLLESLDSKKQYEFTPYNGLHRI